MHLFIFFAAPQQPLVMFHRISSFLLHTSITLCNHGAGSSTLVSPGWGESTNSLVVTRQTVDTGLDENKAELGVLVLSVALKMLSDSDGLYRDLATGAGKQ